MTSAESWPHDETQDWTEVMNDAEGQKHFVSEFEVQAGRVVSQVFRQEGRRGGQGEVGCDGGGDSEVGGMEADEVGGVGGEDSGGGGKGGDEDGGEGGDEDGGEGGDEDGGGGGDEDGGEGEVD